MGSDYKHATKPPAYEGVTILNQAAPVQNTWYPVYTAPGPVRVVSVSFRIMTANETIEIRMTIDGVVTAMFAVAAVAGTVYSVEANQTPGVPEEWLSAAQNNERAFLVEARNDFFLEIRKTTALGAGVLGCKIHTALY